MLSALIVADLINRKLLTQLSSLCQEQLCLGGIIVSGGSCWSFALLRDLPELVHGFSEVVAVGSLREMIFNFTQRREGRIIS